jgi:hypothetical protein
MGEKFPIKFSHTITTSTVIVGFFYKLQHGADGFTSHPKEGPKNPTVSAGFEPVNLGTRGQHANH